MKVDLERLQRLKKKKKEKEEGVGQRFSPWKETACLEEKQIYNKPARATFALLSLLKSSLLFWWIGIVIAVKCGGEC